MSFLSTGFVDQREECGTLLHIYQALEVTKLRHLGPY